MDAKPDSLLSFLSQSGQFQVPIFQRVYSWELEDWNTLWDDIMHAGANDQAKSYFIGSIVFVDESGSAYEPVRELVLIDGQQRLTTVSMLLAALRNAIQRSGAKIGISVEDIEAQFLYNPRREDELKYKLMLTRDDKETFTALIDNNAQVSGIASKRLINCYDFYVQKLDEPDVDLRIVYKGLSKLLIVKIGLDRGEDPQEIFESLNSTGRELTQADLIRNYVLMNLERLPQNDLYNKYWWPMQQLFADNGLFDRFMRDYLTIKSPTREIPNERKVYRSFKLYMQGLDAPSVTEVAADLYMYAKYYVRIVELSEPDPDLNGAFARIKVLTSVAYPLLLELYDDYSNSRLTKPEFLIMLRLVESYVVRRAVCRFAPAGLNKVFPILTKQIDKARYLDAFQAALELREGSLRFPSDAEVRDHFVTDVPNGSGLISYILQKLETYGRKEPVSFEGLTLEHIMPQNKNLLPAWRRDLGDNWQSVHAKYLNTMGNLTLTGYNPELSDRPFIDKRDAKKGGYAESPLRLNQYLRQFDKWDEQTIITRAHSLADTAVQIWPAPHAPEDLLISSRPTVVPGSVISPMSISLQKATMRDDLVAMIKATGSVELAPSNKAYIRFYPREWNIPELTTGTGWRPSPMLLLFEFVNNAQELWLKLMLGPGPEDTRHRLFDLAQKVQPPFKPMGRQATRWTQLWRETVIPTSMFEEGRTNEFADTLKSYWGNFLNNPRNAHGLQAFTAAVCVEFGPNATNDRTAEQPEGGANREGQVEGSGA